MSADDLSITEARRRTVHTQRRSTSLLAKIERVVPSVKDIQRQNGYAAKVARAYGLKR